LLKVSLAPQIIFAVILSHLLLPTHRHDGKGHVGRRNDEQGW
jgi:hypothetical protein